MVRPFANGIAQPPDILPRFRRPSEDLLANPPGHPPELVLLPGKRLVPPALVPSFLEDVPGNGILV